MLEKLSFYSALIFVFVIGILAFILLLIGQTLRDRYQRARNRKTFRPGLNFGYHIGAHEMEH